MDEELATEYIQEMVSWGFVHILEISGGTYANPGMLNVPRWGFADTRSVRKPFGIPFDEAF